MNTSENAQPGGNAQRPSWQSGTRSVCDAFANAFHELGRALTPPENVEKHFREAHKQALLGLRELIDHRIQKMSRDGSRGTSVPVD